MRIKIKCEDCKENKATIKYSDNPFMTLTHSWGAIDLCKECYTKRIEKHIADCKDNLKKLNTQKTTNAN